MNSFHYKIVPIFSWIIITLPFWLSFFHPAIVAYFIIGFDIYFFYKSINTTYLATLSYSRILKTEKINFFKRLNKFKNYKKIVHFIVIPNYKEKLSHLEQTIDFIAKNQFNKKQLNLVLAFEEREKEAKMKAIYLKKKFNKKFNKIYDFYHSLKKDEIAGKASNQSYAVREIDKIIEKRKIDRKMVLITICDADSLLPKKYLSYLTYKFLNDSDRLYHFYWAPVLLYSNFWQLPFFIRIQATLSSILRLAFLSREKNLIQISTYSTNLWLLKKVNFWETNIIPEDWHIYLQAFFRFGEKVRTIPLYTIINAQAVYSGNLIKTIKNRYEQEKRWAWGVSDIGYSIKKFFETPKISPWLKLKKIIFLTENHLLWPTTFFILTISASIPPLINPYFKRTVFGFLLPKIAAFILTLSTSMLIVYIILDILIRKRVKQKTKIKSLPFLIIQWYFLPIISFFFSALPALEAHTKLLLGKKLEYKVTEKG